MAAGRRLFGFWSIRGYRFPRCLGWKGRRRHARPDGLALGFLLGWRSGGVAGWFAPPFRLHALCRRWGGFGRGGLGKAFESGTHVVGSLLTLGLGWMASSGDWPLRISLKASATAAFFSSV